MRVLVVDDHPDAAVILAESLRMKGWPSSISSSRSWAAMSWRDNCASNNRILTCADRICSLFAPSAHEGTIAG